MTEWELSNEENNNVFPRAHFGCGVGLWLEDSVS